MPRHPPSDGQLPSFCTSLRPGPIMCHMLPAATIILTFLSFFPLPAPSLLLLKLQPSKYSICTQHAQSPHAGDPNQSD